MQYKNRMLSDLKTKSTNQHLCAKVHTNPQPCKQVSRCRFQIHSLSLRQRSSSGSCRYDLKYLYDHESVTLVLWNKTVIFVICQVGDMTSTVDNPWPWHGFVAINVQNTIPCWPRLFLFSPQWQGGSGQPSDPRVSNCHPPQKVSAAGTDSKKT